MDNIKKSLLRQDLKDLQTSPTYYSNNYLRELIGLFIAVMDGSHTVVENKPMNDSSMHRYYYSLSENSWEYTGAIEVEASEKPICTNTDDEHSLEVNGVKIFFDEEIEEANI